MRTARLLSLVFVTVVLFTGVGVNKASCSAYSIMNGMIVPSDAAWSQPGHARSANASTSALTACRALKRDARSSSVVGEVEPLPAAYNPSGAFHATDKS
jgi:hypothetical protein